MEESRARQLRYLSIASVSSQQGLEHDCFPQAKAESRQHSSLEALYHVGMACAYDNAQERIVEDAGERAECLGAELRLARGH